MCFNFSVNLEFNNENGEFPTSVNRGDVFLPPKSVNGPKSGCWAVASYIELIHNKLYGAGSINGVDQLYKQASELNKQQSAEIDDEYPTFQNIMTCADLNSGLQKGVKYFNTIASIKRNIHKYGAVMIETYLTNQMLTNVHKQSGGISKKDDDKIIYNDYTKLFLAVAYDKSGLIVMNTLGRGWGSNGFARIAWDYLSSNLVTPSDESKRVFIKGAVIKNCLG